MLIIFYSPAVNKQIKQNIKYKTVEKKALQLLSSNCLQSLLCSLEAHPLLLNQICRHLTLLSTISS